MQLSVQTSLNTAPSLADFTKPGLIIPQLQGHDKMAVIGELSQAMKADRRMPPSSPFYQAVLNRELLASTEMERGVAFPHARLRELKELFFALGRSDQPLSWADQVARRVRLVFLIAASDNDSGEYLRLISGLVRLTRETRLIKQLEAAQNVSSMFEVLRQVKMTPRRPLVAAA
jgi:PTS system fructose-specific IIC component